MYYLISILLGLIPEVLYFTLFLIYTKSIKKRKILLFILIGIAYFICLLIQQYRILNYLILLFLIYIILKILYRNGTQIIDIFIISLSYLYLIIISIIPILFLRDNLSNYYFLYIIDRVLLFLPFLSRNKFNILYKKYCSLWNRNDNIKKPIKSITLRNISLILLNLIILVSNIILISIIKLL